MGGRPTLIRRHVGYHEQKKIVGIEIERNRTIGQLKITQTQYVENLLVKYNMTDYTRALCLFSWLADVPSDRDATGHSSCSTQTSGVYLEAWPSPLDSRETGTALPKGHKESRYSLRQTVRF